MGKAVGVFSVVGVWLEGMMVDETVSVEMQAESSSPPDRSAPIIRCDVDIRFGSSLSQKLEIKEKQVG